MASDGPRQVTSAVAGVWSRARPAVLAGVALQERAIVAVLAGELDTDTRANALRAAHKLAGGLGTYGFTEASAAAHQLEQVWESTAPLRSTDAASLAAVAVELRRGLPADGQTQTEMILAADIAIDADGASSACDVLVVDDDAVICAFVEKALSEKGYVTESVRDGRRAIDTISNPATRPRLVLLDIDMPGENGFRVLRRLRHAGALADTRVMMLTGRGSTATVQQAAALGAVDYLVKPFSAPLLIERVERALPASGTA